MFDQGVAVAAMPLSVGDHAGIAVPRAALVIDGPARWYALRVQPQREDQAEAWLARRGVYAFHPVLPRKVRLYGKLREYHRRYLPGYSFARFDGQPLTHEVMACPFIIGALCRSDGAWGALQPSRLQAIHAMRKVDAEVEGARRAAADRRRQALSLKQGDAVMFRSGPLSDMQGEVVSLRAQGGAVVRLVLFGRDMDVDADGGDLVALREAS